MSDQKSNNENNGGKKEKKKPPKIWKQESQDSGPEWGEGIELI